MGCYFLNTLLPKANPPEVCEAICRWHTQEGYLQQFGRRPFDCDSIYGDSVVYVLSNQSWCVLISFVNFEEHLAMRRALSDFPAVLQLWGMDGGWGYNLEERGAPTSSFCTKSTLRGCIAVPREPGNLERVATACGVAGAMPQLRRIERARFTPVQKSCAQFAEALGAPVAAMHFYDLEKANAGMAEERMFRGWRMQILSFHKPGQKPPPMIPPGFSLTAEQRQKMQCQVKKTRMWTALLMPFVGIMALLTFIPLILGGFLVMLFGKIPWVRKLTLGKATLFCDEFLAELEKAQPILIEINGDVAVNTRHNCSITTPSPAQTLPTFWARKPIPREDPVFNVKLNGHALHCEGYSQSRLPTWRGITVLEKREFPIGNCNAEFERWETLVNDHRWAHYQWTVKAPAACYRFSCVSEKDIAPRELETMENIVRSFSIGSARNS